MRPPALEELGLFPAVELLLQHGSDAGCDAVVTVEGEVRRLAPQSELALFRIIQKAWSNIRRHAQVRTANFHFAYSHDGLVVTISDDGQGFIPLDEQHMPDGHWGYVRNVRMSRANGRQTKGVKSAKAWYPIEVFIP